MLYEVTKNRKNHCNWRRIFSRKIAARTTCRTQAGNSVHNMHRYRAKYFARAESHGVLSFHIDVSYDSHESSETS